MPLLKSSDPEQDILTEREAEYQQLQLAIRLAQADRTHYVEEMSAAMSKMNKTIQELEQDGEALRKEMNIVDNPNNQIRDRHICENLLNLAQNKDWLQEQINTERSKHVDMDMKIKNAEKRVENLKIKFSSSAGSVNMYDRFSAKMTSLQNKLVYRLKMYNQSIGRNSSLRHEIDTLRMYRCKFDQLYHRLQETLAKQRVSINRLMESTSQAFDQREDAAQRIQQLSERSDKDLQQHNNEMKELIRSVDHAKKLRKFMQTKATERQEDPMLTAWKVKQVHEAEKNREELDRTVEKYEQAFQRMMELTGEENTDSLVESFLEREDRNFALFNYLSEINLENGRLKAENNELAQQIAELQDSTANEVDGRQDALQDLQVSSEQAALDLGDVSDRLTTTSVMLDNVCSLIEKMVLKLECDTSTLDRRLASAKKVTQDNLLDYMNLIEDRINALLLVLQFRTLNDPDSPFVAKSLLLGSSLTMAGGEIPKIRLPNNLHPPSSSISDQVSEIVFLNPMSRADIHKQVFDVFTKKEDKVPPVVVLASPDETPGGIDAGGAASIPVSPSVTV